MFHLEDPLPRADWSTKYSENQRVRIVYTVHQSKLILKDMLLLLSAEHACLYLAGSFLARCFCLAARGLGTHCFALRFRTSLLGLYIPTVLVEGH